MDSFQQDECEAIASILEKVAESVRNSETVGTVDIENHTRKDYTDRGFLDGITSLGRTVDGDIHTPEYNCEFTVITDE